MWENQQVTKGWIVGIIDGEGHFDAQNHRIKITNTNFDIIRACESYFKQTGILCKYWHDTAKTKTGKTIHRLMISNREARNFWMDHQKLFECRIENYQQLFGSSTTTRDLPLTVDRDWLRGIWQAEGSFYLNDRGTRYQPILTMVNTENRIIMKAATTLKALGLSWHITNLKLENRKPISRMSILGVLRCKRFLNEFKNEWIGSRDMKRSNLLLEFIELRLAKDRNDPICLKEIDIFNQMKMLNS